MSLYESETQDKILNRMNERIPAKYDKREGSLIHYANAPASVEFQNAYISMNVGLNNSFADTADREHLILLCAERGITPKPASYPIVLGTFTPTTCELVMGTRFSYEDYNYTVIENQGQGKYLLQCETIGSEANYISGRLIPINYVQGLESAEITETVIFGEDEEDTESLRIRYKTSLQAEQFGGNRADYKNKVNSISGVGGVKIYSGSEWNGGGTVKLVIVDSNNHSPSDELVDVVQEKIDPLICQGEGMGVAPIGHFVTVVGAYDTKINVSFRLTYKTGYTWASVESSVKTIIKDYLNELNETWSEVDAIVIRRAVLESRILEVSGVLDIHDTTINGAISNLKVDKDSVVSIGDVVDG